MEILKQLTAIPLFATVAWLVWVYGSLFSSAQAPTKGVDRVLVLLISLILLSIAGWALGRWPARNGSTLAAVLIAAIALFIPLYQPRDTTLVWSAYTPATLAAARAAGHPVFIDFTAAWCLSCQVNERLVLRSADVQKQLADHKLTLIRADWTQYDPAITSELAAIHRSGVPTYVLYPSARDAAPDVLPEVLTKSLVLEAIGRDAK